jgi:hypothetical protein
MWFLFLMFASALARPMPTTVKFGIATLNYADADTRRNPDALSMEDALENLGPKILRFPGGLEASSYLWATAPTWLPDSHAPAFNTTSRWPNSVDTIVKKNKFVDAINFDEFMANAGDADIAIVINFDSMYTDDGPSKEFLIETARQWVRYCKMKNYTVTYWEIGNESDMTKSAYNGFPENGTRYGEDFIDFAVAMREEDDTILIGMNGSKETFMRDVLDIAGEHVDFVAIHPFPLWGFSHGYDDYMAGEGHYEDKYDIFVKALANSSVSEQKKNDIFAMITETSPVDWSAHDSNRTGWLGNDVGHMIAFFDMLGRFAAMPKVRGGIIAWTTHWVEHAKKTDVFELFNQDNKITPIGRALYIWASLGDVISARRELIDNVVAFFVETTTGQKILLANRSEHEKPFAVEFAYHGDQTNSTLVVRSDYSPVLPKYSIAIM